MSISLIENQRLAETVVAVVIVNYRTPELTKRCVASLRHERELLPKLEALVVDGGSNDGSSNELAAALAHPDYLGWVSFLPLPLNGGYAWANNQAMLTLARNPNPPEYVHVLNPDTEVIPGAVAALLRELMIHPRCGATGSLLLTRGGDASASAFHFPSIAKEFAKGAQSGRLGEVLGIGSTVVKSTESCDVDWVTGASVMFRVTALLETGLFDDGFFLYFEEVELMHRLRLAGWTVRHVPDSRVMHLEGASTGVGGYRSLPVYWYQSRLRYFALTRGRPLALVANFAWLIGRVLAIHKAFGGKIDLGMGRLGDLARFGFWPRVADAQSSAPHWGDQPGRLPLWLARL